MLTGRVSSIGGTGRLNDEGTEYIYNGRLTQAERMDEFGFYVSDSWRVKPNMTLTMGLRYELQLPMVPTKSTRTTTTLEIALRAVRASATASGGRPCNLFNPGVFNNPDAVPTYEQYSAETTGYNTDMNNFAPVVGITYRPTVDGRLLAAAPRRSGTGGAERRLHPRRSTASASTGSRASSAATRARRPRRRATPPPPASRSCRPASRWPLLFSRDEPAGSAELPEDADLPDHRGDQQQRRDLRRRTSRCRYTDSWTVGFQRALTTEHRG